MQVRLLSYATQRLPLVCVAYPGILQGACNSPMTDVQQRFGMNYPQNSSQNNVACASMTVPTSSSAPGFPSGTTIAHITVTLTD